MKTLRRILVVITCILLIIISVGYLMPAKVSVERSLLIKYPPNIIFAQVNNLQKWEKWSPWVQADTSVEFIYSGPESGVGARSSWESPDKNIGKGSLTISSSFPYDSVLLVMDYAEKGKSTSKFRFVHQNQGTNVIWTVESSLGMNPVSRWFGLFMDHMVGPDLESGLFNLSELMDDLNQQMSYEIVNFDSPSGILVSVRDTASPPTLPVKLASMFERVSVLLKNKGISPTGPPIAVYHAFSKEYFDIEAGIPISKMVSTPKGISCTETASQKTLMIKYFGSYKLIGKAYSFMQSYVKDKGIQISGPVWEEYVNNPNLEPDSNLWQTNIYYPVK